MGLKLPEMPFCVGFAAALVALGGDWKHQARAADRPAASAGVLGFALFSGRWMLHMDHLTGNPLFPYFNEYWQSPLALAAPYRDLRFVPDPFLARSFSSRSCSRWTGMSPTIWASRTSACCSPISLVIAAHRWSGCCGAQSRDPLLDNRVRAAVCSPSPRVSYFVWLQILRHLSLHHPAGDAGAAADRRRAWACCRCRGARAI